MHWRTTRAGHDPNRSSLPSGRGSTIEGARQKSFSTVSCPILACSALTSASWEAVLREGLRANTSGRLSRACPFHCAITLGCKLCLAASLAIFWSPRRASKATLALNWAGEATSFSYVSILPKIRGPPLGLPGWVRLTVRENRGVLSVQKPPDQTIEKGFRPVGNETNAQAIRRPSGLPVIIIPGG